MQGRILKNISNKYFVEEQKTKKVYECYARGKFKKEEIKPVVGDLVIYEVTDSDEGIIHEILPRVSYMKRPKIANISQIILVVSMDMPKPDLLLLDKQLAFAEYLHIKPMLIINKIDLVKEKEYKKIEQIYQMIGYSILITRADKQENTKCLYEHLKGEISVLSGNSGVRQIDIVKYVI